MISSSRGLTISLAIAFVALCTVVGAEVVDHRMEHPAEITARPAAPPMRPDVPRPMEAPEHGAWFQEIVARPLFSPDRRPTVSDARTIQGLPRLTGVIVNGPRRVAIFAASQGGSAVVVEAGSRVGVYEVREVTDAGVTVLGPEGTTVIRPTFDTAPPSPRATRPASAPRPEVPRPATK
jgi:hypothetical protein